MDSGIPRFLTKSLSGRAVEWKNCEIVKRPVVDYSVELHDFHAFG